MFDEPTRANWPCPEKVHALRPSRSSREIPTGLRITSTIVRVPTRELLVRRFRGVDTSTKGCAKDANGEPPALLYNGQSSASMMAGSVISIVANSSSTTFQTTSVSAPK